MTMTDTVKTRPGKPAVRHPELTIRIAAPTPAVRAVIRAEVAGALLGEERERAVLTESNSLARPKGELEPDVTVETIRDVGSLVLISGAPGSGKSTIAARIRQRLRRINYQYTPVVTRVQR